MKYHYIYRITNILLSKHYYGVRSTKVLPREDLGIKYFSSSKDKDFINDQMKNPKNYKYKVIMVYKTRDKAIRQEIKLHNKFDVGINESFYNKAKQTSIGWDTTGTKRTKESRLKQSKSTKGKKRSKEWCEKISKALKDHPSHKTEDFREKCRLNNLGKNNPNFRKPVSEERKKKVSEKLKNNPLIICPHCSKKGSVSPMRRWHFDNCRNKESTNNEDLQCEF